MEDTVQRALEKTRELLEDSFPDSDEIHRTKSLLYAAIERTGMKAERLLSLQRLLRELLILVTGSGDLRDYERRLAQALLGDLQERYAPELGGAEDSNALL
jgi:hypothetical protein